MALKQIMVPNNIVVPEKNIVPNWNADHKKNVASDQNVALETNEAPDRNVAPKIIASFDQKSASQVRTHSLNGTPPPRGVVNCKEEMEAVYRE